MRVIPAVVCLLAAAPAPGQSQVTNAELRYRFTLPNGFTNFPEGRSQKDVVDCWTEGAPTSSDGPIVLCVQRLHGKLPREAMRQEDVPATAQVISFKWKSFEISGIRTLASQAGKQVFVLVAQVPLAPEAVQLFAGGPADQEARGQEILASTLATLEGETNWLTAAERSERLGRVVGLAIGIALAAIAVGIWRKRRRASAA
jgi:hypothetical protein